MMEGIEELVERYDAGHSNLANRIFHFLGIMAANLGILGLLWSIPPDLVQSWLGDHTFANWATVYAVLMIIYYGSQSFSLTFAGGLFFQGCLYVIWLLMEMEIMPLTYLSILMVLMGLALMFTGHIIQGNWGAILKDIKYLPISITWIFRFVYRWLGVSF